MKIAFVNQPWNAFLPPVEIGSIAIWTDRVARVLSRHPDHRVVVLGRTTERKPIRTETAGLRHHAVPLGLGPGIERLRDRLGLDREPRTPRLLSPAAYGGFQRRILAALVDERPDVVHVQNLAQFAPRIRSLLPDARIVLHMHCEWLSQLDRAWMARLIAPVDAIVCCSEAVAEAARSAHPGLGSRVHVVPNGVDTDRFLPSPEPTSPPRTILFVGRISPEKGLHLLLPAFRALAADRDDVRLRIVGPHAETARGILVDLSDDPRVRALAVHYEHDYLQHLRQLAAPLGPRVEFVGGVPQRQLPTMYAEAHLVVQPSLYESFGMPIIEAMACGRAVVATRTGGMTELIDDGIDGLLAQPDDENSLRDILARAIDDRPLRAKLGEAGVRTARTRFSWERVTDAVLRVYACAR